jgi:hypothetical protein
VPEADVGSVDVDDEDMDDPELAAELAAMTGEDGGAETVPVPVGVDADDDDDELAGELDDLTAADETEPAAPPPIAAVPAPAPPPAVAAQVPAGVTSEELEAEVKRIQAKMLEFAMVGEAPPAELVAQLKDAKARVEAFEAGPPPLDPSFIANPLDPSLIESNEVLASEKNRLTAEMMVFLEQGTVAPMSIVDVMKVIQFKIKTLEGEMEAGLDPQKYADRLQMAAERDDKIVAALRDTGRDEEAERVSERIVATRNEHAGVLAHILSLQGGGDDGEDADDADSGGLSDLEDEEEPAVDVQARIDEFDAQIKKLKQEALSLKKLGKIDEAKVPYRRMKQIEKNKETFLAGVGATQQLQKVAAQQRDDPDTIKRKLEQALKGAEEAARTGDEETKAKYMKQAQIFQAQWKEAKASVVTPVVPEPAVEQGPPPLTEEQKQAYQKLHKRLTQQAQVARDQAELFKRDKQMAAAKVAIANYQTDMRAMKLLKAYADQRRPEPPQYTTEERGYTVTTMFQDIKIDKVQVTAVKATFLEPIKNTFIRVVYDYEEVNDQPLSVDGTEGSGDAASPEYNSSHLFRIERPHGQSQPRSWAKFERKLCKRKLLKFVIVEKGWFGKETVKGSADWPNPKIATRPEDQGKGLPTAPGPHDFGALRTRAEVSCDLPIQDETDIEKTLGTLSVMARVKIPLECNPKDGSGADSRRKTFSEMERQTLIFAEDPDALQAAAPAAGRSTAATAAAERQSLGSVPTAEPAAPKRGGAAKAAARAPKKAATAGGGGGGGGGGALGAAAQQYGLPVALLQHPTSVAAYAQSYAMLEREMALIQIEIQVCSQHPLASQVFSSSQAPRPIISTPCLRWRAISNA